MTTTRTISNAIKERDEAIKSAEALEAKAAEQRAEAEKIEAGSNQAIIEDPTSAERITVQVMSLQRMARAYEAQARQARQNAAEATRNVLNVEAEELDKQADKLRGDAEKHEAEVDKLRAKLEAFDGCEYSRTSTERYDATGRLVEVSTPNGKAGDMRWQAQHAETQAQVIRYWLQHDTLPRSLDELNEQFDADHDLAVGLIDGNPIHRYGPAITDNLQAVLDNPGTAQGE